jgi:S-adenosylmethionine decarboxylase
MDGLHLTADLAGCPPGLPVMTQPDALQRLCRTAVQEAGLQAVGELFHGFPSVDGEPRGVTGTVLLAESHLAVHTWPERGGVTLDVYVCNFGADNSARARRLMATLVQAFQASHIDQQALRRGRIP